MVLTSEIGYHYTLHGFWEWRGTGITTFEAKIIQQLTATREAVLYDILLDLQKVYVPLDKYSCLEILDGYSIGPSTLRLIWTYWGRLQIVVKSGGDYVPTFKGYQGVTQEDPIYYKIFNMVVEAIIIQWVMAVSPMEA